MMAFSLYNKYCSNKITYVPSIKLGDGADGEVFDIIDDPNKVIKFSVRYDFSHDDLFNSYKTTVAPALEFLIKFPVDIYATVYDHQFLGTYERDYLSDHNDKQNVILYYYVMEKLNKISEDEKKVFHSILSHEDCNLYKNYSIDKIKNILNGLSYGLDFDMDKTIMFCEKLKYVPVVQPDMHPRNIMKDHFGNFKFIDFDRCYLRKDT